MNARLCRHYFVSGRVQGVGYRFFVLRAARELTIDGWVRNLDDGRVELVACADEERLERLEEKLWRGPTLSDVSGIDHFPVADGGFRDFVIA